MREGSKEIVFHACLGTVANHLALTCSTEGSSPGSSNLCRILFTSTHWRLMVKSFRAECKFLFCLRFPTIGKDGLAFKNSWTIWVGIFLPAFLRWSQLSPMLCRRGKRSRVLSPLVWSSPSWWCSLLGCLITSASWWAQEKFWFCRLSFVLTVRVEAMCFCSFQNPKWKQNYKITLGNCLAGSV